MRSTSLTAHVVVILVLLLLPLGADHLFSGFYISLMARVFIYAIMILGFDLLAGYTGMISYGHAMFFGTGAYVTAMLLKHVTAWFWPSLLASVVGCGLLAYVVGYLSIRTREVYFVFLTFAFAQFFFVAANSWEFVGAANGLAGIPKPIVLPGLDLSNSTVFYYFCLIVLAAAYGLARLFIRSPFGRILVGIRENEERTQFLGYDTHGAIRRVFVISGMYGGAAGALMASMNSFASPVLYHPAVSGEIIIAALIGGMGTLVGPVLGAGVIILLTDLLSSWLAEAWMMIVGALFAFCVLFTPDGLMGLIRRFRSGRAAPGGSGHA
ncbi:MAG: branched-chain amino acid ABC transporter permease [Proteobacteria bacterium]|nr:branched-chain amino acid ABC transporter permease [Pseudomonadota bacterium]